MKKIGNILLAFCFIATIKAQQVEEFSLLRENAFVLNPAYAGTQGWLHGTLTGRMQFTKIDQAPYTAMLALDGQIVGTNLSIGGYLLHDQTGPTGKSSLTVAAAYNIPLYKKYAARFSNGTSKHNLSIGISLSAVQYRMRGDQLLVNDANDPGLYSSKGSKIFPDASFGIYYRYKQVFYFGISVPQIMGLNVNYRGSDGIAKIKKVQQLDFMAGGKIEMNRGNFSLDPIVALRWERGAPPQGDIGLRAVMYKIFWLGATYRSLNYMVFDAGFTYKNKFSVSYAYNLNFARYRNDIGATHELSLSFTVARSQRVWRGKGAALRF